MENHGTTAAPDERAGHFMRRAIALSRASLEAGGGPFGAVVVRDDAIIGEGQNAVVPRHDPTAHAEIMAIRNACDRLRSHSLAGCVLFTSCEPCPMCLAAAWWARIDHIFYGNTRDDAKAIGFDDAALYVEVARPLDRRRLPLTRLLATEAATVFAQWQALPGKVPY